MLNAFVYPDIVSCNIGSAYREDGDVGCPNLDKIGGCSVKRGDESAAGRILPELGERNCLWFLTQILACFLI